ncbi:unnamed protein product [Calypogeia fissa]
MGRPLVFALNGERVALTEVDPRTTVLQYIRSQPNLQGTKFACGEGGCGACTVLLSKYDPTTKRVEELTINACLAPLCSIDGCAITTTEGLKKSKSEYHAIHKRLAGFHASQCGFCTPGMTMSIYGVLRKAACAKADTRRGCGPSKSNGHSSMEACNGNNNSSAVVPITTLDAIKSIAGNICRCTGYRPIMDTCKSFSGEVDVEDLGLNSFWASKEKADATLLPHYNPEKDPKFPTFLIEELESRNKKNSPPNPLNFEHEEGREATLKRQWITADSLSKAFDLLKEYSKENLEVQLVVGNTSAGVYKDIHPQVYIDVSEVPELQVVKRTGEGLELGAGIALSKLIGLLGESNSGSVVYQELAKHAGQIATEQVRNRASLGGNLILARNHGFDSDLATILLGAGAEVTVASAEGRSKIPLEEFFSQGRLEPGKILTSIHIPSWSNLSTPEAKVSFKTYRISCRPNGNSLAYINAAFLAIVDESALVVTDLKLAFGAFGGSHAIRARKTEKLIVGKPISPAGLLEAIKVLKVEISPPSTVHKSAYRSSVAVGYFFHFFNSSLFSSKSGHASIAIPACEEEAVPKTILNCNGMVSHDLALSSGTASNGDSSSNGSAHTEPCEDTHTVEFGAKTKHEVVTGKSQPLKIQASQKFATSNEFWPVGQPAEKTVAHLQAAGEAVYVDDITPIKGTLYAAFVLSDRRAGKILSIDASEALKSPGAVDFMSAKDLPGKNIAYDCFNVTDRLFAEDRVECIYDTVGPMIADSYENARAAASKVRVNVEEQEGRLFTIEDAIAKESFIEPIGFFASAKSASVGEDLVKGDHRIENGEVFCGSQYQFYMETQSAYAVPDEDETITVYSATQAVSDVQKAVSLSLGIPMNSVRIITRRLGGGFGGKLARAILVAVACALAATKMKRPVRIALDRQTDMRMAVGRHEAKGVYTVDFKDDGKIVGLNINIFVNCGRGKDLSGLVLYGIKSCLGQYDWGSLRYEGKLCCTNRVSSGIFRGPGDIQGHFMAETVIEHVAAYLGIDSWKVRERNMHSVETINKFFPYQTSPVSVDSHTLPYIWQKLKDQSHFEERSLAVRKFNESSKWEKKGIDMVVGVYTVGTLPRQARVSVFEDGSVVVEVGGIEMGQGLYTKVKQAVAYGLSKLWGPNAHPSEKVDTSRIRVVQNDSISLANSKVTGGSTTSQSSVLAVLTACESFVESLKPFLDQVRQSGASPASWLAIITMANIAGVSLTAHGDTSAAGFQSHVNFGVCVSEVSINVLTGATTILRTDLLYDCGRSLNPAVDIGQIEGSFINGVGFYLTEEVTFEDGRYIPTGTWDYKPPTADNIPQQFHVELSNTKANKNKFLSSKASGEPPILLAKSVHSAVRNAIAAARDDLRHLPASKVDEHVNGGVPRGVKGNAYFRLDSPASIDKVKTLCGLDNVERYLASLQ